MACGHKMLLVVGKAGGGSCGAWRVNSRLGFSMSCQSCTAAPKLYEQVRLVQSHWLEKYDM
eukprot:1143980-Pelagomonas_calceolata.AAC.5